MAELRWRENPKKKEIDKKYRQTEEAKKKAVSRTQNFLKRHPEYIEKRKIYQQNWINRIGYEHYRIINNTATRKYAKTAKGKRVAKNYKYLSRNNKAGKIDWDAWLEKLEYLENRCQCCGTTEHITIDHIVPLSRGGTNAVSNLQPLCRSCNCRKGNKYEGDVLALQPQI